MSKSVTMQDNDDNIPPHMMTSSNGNIFRVTGHLCREFTGNRWIPRKGPWRGALMFSLICTCINCWVNNRQAGDLRRHRARYDVIVMNRPPQQPRNPIIILKIPSISSKRPQKCTHKRKHNWLWKNMSKVVSLVQLYKSLSIPKCLSVSSK